MENEVKGRTKKIKTPIELYIIGSVKQRREEQGFTQEALSFALNFNHAFVSNRENGTKTYNSNHLNKIAKILKCSPKDFWPNEPI